MRPLDTPGAWAERDDEQAAADLRRDVGRAQTEDEHLDALRSAGSLAGGIAATHPAADLPIGDRILLAELYRARAQRRAGNDHHDHEAATQAETAAHRREDAS